MSIHRVLRRLDHLRLGKLPEALLTCFQKLITLQRLKLPFAISSKLWENRQILRYIFRQFVILFDFLEVDRCPLPLQNLEHPLVLSLDLIPLLAVESLGVPSSEGAILLLVRVLVGLQDARVVAFDDETILCHELAVGVPL